MCGENRVYGVVYIGRPSRHEPIPFFAERRIFREKSPESRRLLLPLISLIFFSAACFMNRKRRIT